MLEQIDENQSANTEEFADLPLDEESTELESQEAEQSEESSEVADPEPQRDLEKDRAYAEMRRAKEEAERRASQADQWAKDNFGHLGINTMEEYQTALAEQKKREEYAEKGIDYDEVRKIAQEEANNHPNVKKAKEIEQKYAVNAEIRALKAAYPDVDISEVDDLRDLGATLSKLPNWDQIADKVLNRGYDLKDAFELANRDMILGKQTAAAAQAARNNARSKDHLKPSGSQAAGDGIVIDPETMKMFKQLFPKKTDAEIIAWKKKQMRQG